MSDVTTVSTSAGIAASTRSAGSIWNEKNRKNVAANRSRNGEISSLARSSARPGQRESHEECTDGARHLELLREAGDEQA